MKFLILDIYPKDDWRLVKDTAGGYGTGNDFGNTFFSKALNKFVSKMISMPPMYAMYIYSILKAKGQEVEYERSIKNEKAIDDADYIIMPSSIIASETEIEVIKNLTTKSKKIFVVGIFSSVLKNRYKMKNSYIVPGEPEGFFLKVAYDIKTLDSFFENNRLVPCRISKTPPLPATRFTSTP